MGWINKSIHIRFPLCCQLYWLQSIPKLMYPLIFRSKKWSLSKWCTMSVYLLWIQKVKWRGESSWCVIGSFHHRTLWISRNGEAGQEHVFKIIQRRRWQTTPICLRTIGTSSGQQCLDYAAQAISKSMSKVILWPDTNGSNSGVVKQAANLPTLTRRERTRKNKSKHKRRYFL